jgi:hypothetical protein
VIAYLIQQFMPEVGANPHPRLNRMLYVAATRFLADHNLNYTHQMDMSVGVEARVLLRGREVICLAMQNPTGFKDMRCVPVALGAPL